MSFYDAGVLEVAENFKIGDSIANDYWKATGGPRLGFCDAKDSEYTMRKLNGGVFHSLLMCYVQKNGIDIELSSVFNRRAVYLGAYAMKLGVIIRTDDMNILRATFDKIKMCPTAEAQMKEALAHYKSNGEEWDFKEGHHLSSKIHLSPT